MADSVPSEHQTLLQMREEDAEHAFEFRLLGQRCRLGNFILAPKDSGFDVDNDGVPSWPEFSKYLKHKGQEAARQACRHASARKPSIARSRVLLLAVLTSLTVVGSIGAVALLHTTNYTQAGDFEFSLKLETPRCKDASGSRLRSSAEASAPPAGAFLRFKNLQDPAQNFGQEQWAELLRGSKADILHFTVTGLHNTVAAHFTDIYSFIVPTYVILPPWLLRTLTLGSFKLRLAEVSILLESANGNMSGVVDDACRHYLAANIVPTVDYIASRVMGPRVLTAAVFDPEIAVVLPDSREQAFVDWLPFRCEMTRDVEREKATNLASILSSIQSIPINPLSARTCKAGLGRDTLHKGMYFILANVLIALVLVLVGILVFKGWAIRQYVHAIMNIGLLPFLLRANATDTTLEHLGTHILEASGPLFFVDHLVSNPLECQVKQGDAAMSAFLHWIMIALPTLPIVCCAAFLMGGQHEDDRLDTAADSQNHIRAVQFALLCFATAINLFGFLYASSWYLDLRWTIQAPLRRLLLWPWALALCFSMVYFVENVLCLAMAVLLKPEDMMGVLILVLTPAVYGHSVASRMLALRKSALERLQHGRAAGQVAALLKKNPDVLELSQLEAEAEEPEKALPVVSIILAVGGGMIMLAIVAVWMLVGMAVLTRGDTDFKHRILPTLGAVGLAWERARSQLKSKKDQVTRFSEGVESRMMRSIDSMDLVAERVHKIAEAAEVRKRLSNEPV